MGFLNITLRILTLIFALFVFVIQLIFVALLIQRVAVMKGYEKYKYYWFWMGIFFEFPTLLCLIATPQIGKPNIDDFIPEEEIKVHNKNDEVKKIKVEAPNTFEQLEKLSEKLTSGEITQEEFNEQKSKIMNESKK